jgi:hypothetical protein
MRHGFQIFAMVLFFAATSVNWTPFVLLMKRRDAPQPYFVAWLGSADLLRAK